MMVKIGETDAAWIAADRAHHVATSTAQALEPKITPDAEPEVLSLYGALHLVLAVAAARDNKRGEAHEHLGDGPQDRRAARRGP